MYKKNPYIQCPEEQEKKKKTQKKQTEQQLNLRFFNMFQLY